LNKLKKYDIINNNLKKNGWVNERSDISKP